MRTAEEIRRVKLLRDLPAIQNENHARARATLFRHAMRLDFSEDFIVNNVLHQDILLEISPADLESLTNTTACLDFMVQEAQLFGFTAEKLQDSPGIRIFNPIS